MAIPVNVDNFARAETHRMFAGMTGGAPVNTLIHRREPTPIDAQDVIRMNRDTLYSAAIVDISDGATVTIPDAGGRYLSVMATMKLPDIGLMPTRTQLQNLRRG